jgi:hypothetical protein
MRTVIAFPNNKVEMFLRVVMWVDQLSSNCVKKLAIITRIYFVTCYNFLRVFALA